ncbi:MAG: hypothetical protein ACREMC_07515, partial [Gemmatimonadales bacterium]
AVERRDEGPVEALDHLVRHLVRFVFEPLDRLDVRRAAVGEEWKNPSSRGSRRTGPPGLGEDKIAGAGNGD